MPPWCNRFRSSFCKKSGHYKWRKCRLILRSAPGQFTSNCVVRSWQQSTGDQWNDQTHSQPIDMEQLIQQTEFFGLVMLVFYTAGDSIGTAIDMDNGFVTDPKLAKANLGFCRFLRNGADRLGCPSLTLRFLLHLPAMHSRTKQNSPNPMGGGSLRTFNVLCCQVAR